MITARLRLRELIPDDAPFVLALLNEPSFIEPIGDRGVRTIADARNYIATGPWTGYKARGFGLWLVELIEEGAPIGVCGLLKRDALASPDIGFAFRPAYWSKGYAREAASAVIAFAQDTLRLTRLFAIVSPSNPSSIRLLQTLGFRFERMARLSEGAPEIALFGVSFDTIPQP